MCSERCPRPLYTTKTGHPGRPVFPGGGVWEREIYRFESTLGQPLALS